MPGTRWMGTECSRPEHLRSSSSSSRWDCQGQSAPIGNFLPQGALGISKSLPSRKELPYVSYGAKTVQRWDEEKVVKGRSKQRLASCAHTYCAKLWPTGPRSSRQCCQKHSPEFRGVVQSTGAQLGVPAPPRSWRNPRAGESGPLGGPESPHPVFSALLRGSEHSLAQHTQGPSVTVSAVNRWKEGRAGSEDPVARSQAPSATM